MAVHKPATHRNLDFFEFHWCGVYGEGPSHCLHGSTAAKRGCPRQSELRNAAQRAKPATNTVLRDGKSPTTKKIESEVAETTGRENQEVQQ